MLLEVKIKKVKHIDTKTDYKIFEGTIKEIVSKRYDESEDGLTKNMTFKGNMVSCSEGDTYMIDATFKVHNMQRVMFINSGYLKKIQLESELEKYLINNITGIGKKKAEAIIKGLGVDAVDVIISAEGHERLVEIIKSDKLATEIRNHIIDNHNVFTIMSFLQIHNLPVSYANDILEEYGRESLLDIRNNPYFFIRSIDFKTLDIIAANSKIKAKDERRTIAGIIAIVNRNKNVNGDVYTRISDIYTELNHFLNATNAYKSIELTKDEIYELIVKANNNGDIVVENGEFVYIKYLLQKEKDVAYHIRRLNKYKTCNYTTKEIEEAISIIEKHEKIKASEEQKQAVIKAMQNSVSVLTGLPGAGKTFTVNLILKVYQYLYNEKEIHKQIQLLAPTGKASKRMEELTGMNAKTIHRGLGITPWKPNGATLEADMIIVDECSMLDIYIAGTLLQNIKNGSKVVLVGDIEQLPSVGAGLILRDIIDSEAVETTRLTKLYRQAESSNIVVNSHKLVAEDTNFVWEKDAILWKTEDIEKLEKRILKSYKKLLGDKERGYNRTDIGLLSPMKNGALGTNRINRLIQENFNMNKKEIVVNADLKLRVDDIVIHTVNNYELGVFNGDVGRVLSVEKTVDNLLVIVDYSGQKVEYTKAEINQLELAYCLTIHKSQGSEYKAVISVVSEQHSLMLSKNLIYTAWTRAKEFLVVIGQESAISDAIENKHYISRLSNLSERLKGEKFDKFKPVKRFEELEEDEPIYL